MPHRRILSLWFPRLAAERLLRQARGAIAAPFAIVADENNMQVLSSLSHAASAAGLTPGQPVRDARAMCPTLITRSADPVAEAAFLTTLRRWAGKYSPWVAEEAPGGLVIDLTGCAHLFGGEEALIAQVGEDCDDLGLSVQSGIADTLGAAWALARFAGQTSGTERRGHTGDAIDQEARATRSRAAKRRHWERGGAAPKPDTPAARTTCIAQPGQTRRAIGALPITALRLSNTAVDGLTRLGLRRIDDLAGLPRAALARRFGRDVVRRLDQALGVEPEPVSPARAPDHFAVRLTLPDPIGLEDDLLAGLDRLLPPLAEKLKARGRGARRVALEAHRVDQAAEVVEVGLARPSFEPDRIRPLLKLKLADIDAGFGIDILRLVATVTEPVHDRQHSGHAEAAARGRERMSDSSAMDDLVGRIGARIGLERITRLLPADSHIPEKGSTVMGAAWSEPAGPWPRPATVRPLRLWPPEPVAAPDVPDPPESFRWRRRTYALAEARGPERIAPEWWLDDPNWRSGVRDYWQVITEDGTRLWLYYAHGGEMSAGWFCQGAFA
ncbi:MAG: DNA polymerase Y family protein [Pseudomonadota bacterium]